ncbi:MAG: 2-oxoglutarate ferredoxin oxidoreductase subunit delta [Desulforhopalus sp.]
MQGGGEDTRNHVNHNYLRLQFQVNRNKGMAKKVLRELSINRDWCKGCGICVSFCPKQVLELDSKEKAVAVRPEDCICCMLCELRCPDLAIEVLIDQGSDNE